MAQQSRMSSLHVEKDWGEWERDGGAGAMKPQNTVKNERTETLGQKREMFRLTKICSATHRLAVFFRVRESPVAFRCRLSTGHQRTSPTCQVARLEGNSEKPPSDVHRCPTDDHRNIGRRWEHRTKPTEQHAREPDSRPARAKEHQALQDETEISRGTTRVWRFGEQCL